jgi:CHAD domain-containing protein
MENSEYAHQARVWSRRATAAVALYKDWLPAQKWRTIRESLRAQRRAVETVRTWDVWFNRLQIQAAQAGLDGWAAPLAERRRKAYRKLGKTRRSNLAIAKFRTRCQKLLDLVTLRTFDRNGGKDLREALGATVLARINCFFALKPTGGSTPEQFHRFRLAGKKLRYTLELTHTLFAPALREELYGQLEQILKWLGEMNDLAVFLDLLHHSPWAKTEAGKRLREELLIRQQQARGGYWAMGHPEKLASLRIRFLALCETTGS